MEPLGRIRGRSVPAAHSEAQDDRQDPSPGRPIPVGCWKTWRREANLARALLNVVRNKGAPGVDGQTVEEAEAQAADACSPLCAVLCWRNAIGRATSVGFGFPSPAAGSADLAFRM